MRNRSQPGDGKSRELINESSSVWMEDSEQTWPISYRRAWKFSLSLFSFHLLLRICGHCEYFCVCTCTWKTRNLWMLLLTLFFQSGSLSGLTLSSWATLTDWKQPLSPFFQLWGSSSPHLTFYMRATYGTQLLLLAQHPLYHLYIHSSTPSCTRCLQLPPCFSLYPLQVFCSVTKMPFQVLLSHRLVT